MDKKRCTNFTTDEVELLVCLVEDHREVVECKKTDAVTSSAKEIEWRKIESKFNAACGTGRTAKMLRSKWDSLKKCVKKEYAQHKQSLYKTGGGPSIDIKLTGISNRVLAIIGVGATGTVSIFDSDSVPEEIHETEVVCPNNLYADASVVQEFEIQEVPTDRPIDRNGEIVQMANCSWSAWNPHQLREPKSKVLQVGNSSTPDGEKEEPENSMETNFPTPKALQTNTKRKRFYKAESTSAKLQKERSGVYEELARKKIELLDLQIKLLKEEAERKEQRLAEKHKLEIKILEVELKNKEKSE